MLTDAPDAVFLADSGFDGFRTVYRAGITAAICVFDARGRQQSH